MSNPITGWYPRFLVNLLIVFKDKKPGSTVSALVVSLGQLGMGKVRL